jgi:predicted RND superfamily exporter protein
LNGRFLDDFNEPLPNSRELVGQYLTLLEAQEHFRDFLTFDRTVANVILRVNNNGSEYLLGISNLVNEWWKRHGSPGVSVRTTGIMYEFARAQHAIAVGQLQGLAIDFATIALILLAIFRVPIVALMAVVTNAIPILFVFGVLGFAGIPLDAGTVVTGNLALGIAVDETVFVVNAVMNQGGPWRGTSSVIGASFGRVSPALIATTAAVALGFGVLGVSDFAFTQKMGLLTAAVMVICVVANMSLLPALLVTLNSRIKAKE